MRVHNMSGTHFYHRWEGVVNRCLNPNNAAYEKYGGNGITFYESWKIFKNFMDDMYDSYLLHVEEYGEKNTSLDRIDNYKGYSPSNCRWATRIEQANNKKYNRVIEYKGETDTLCNMSRKYGCDSRLIRNRLVRGWSVERSFETPKQKRTSLR